MSLTYKDSGVDVEAGNSFVRKIAPIVRSTFSERVITDIGGFGALFSASFPEMKEPVLVSGTDGVGTKIRIAQMMGIHDTIGIDAVAMCVNDILTSGARPLFFLDYISCGKLNESILIEVLRGLAEGCKIAGCSLVGGETAEHPDISDKEDYDIAGFAVGIVDREKILANNTIAEGDVIIGLPSSGIHSNGYSLVRKLFFEIKKYNIDQTFSELSESLGKILLTPTKIYCRQVIDCMEKGIEIKGIVHITGGGFYENIPRILPENTAVSIEKSSFTIHPIFKIIRKEGDITDKEMFTTFNMGIGMMLVIKKQDADNIIKHLKDSGEDAAVIGEIIKYRDAKVKIS